MLLCIGEFAGPLVELFLEVGGGGAAMPRNRWRVLALELRRLTAVFFHCCAARRLARAASGHAAAAPPMSVMKSRRLIRSPRRRRCRAAAGSSHRARLRSCG